MGQKKHPFQRELAATASAGTNELRTSVVGDGELLCVQHVAVENETNDYTDLRILIDDFGEEFLVVEEDSPEAATLYWMTEQVYLNEGQRLVCRLTGCTASDVLRAYVLGWRQRTREVTP